MKVISINFESSRASCDLKSARYNEGHSPFLVEMGLKVVTLQCVPPSSSFCYYVYSANLT